MMKSPAGRDARREERANVAAAHDWGWKRIDAPGSREFFARDQQGQTLWLNAREIRSREISWEWPDPSPRYDAFIGVPYSNLGEFIIIFSAPRGAVERLAPVTSGVHRLRWNDETMAAVEYLYDHS